MRAVSFAGDTFGLVATGVLWAAGAGFGGFSGPGFVLGAFGPWRVQRRLLLAKVLGRPEDSPPARRRQAAVRMAGAAAIAIAWWLLAGGAVQHAIG